MQDLISILLPVKNGGDYLYTALDSLCQQTYRLFECIVIDDHSDDGASHAAIQKLNDSRFNLINNQGTGIVDALNTGIAVSKGDFIARMDADDISLTQRFERQITFLQTNRAIDFCGTKINYFSDTKTIDQGLTVYQEWINAQESHKDICNNMFVECAMPHPSFMLRRQLLEKLDGYQDNGWAEDYDIVLRAYCLGARFGKPKEILLNWRDHHTRLSRNDKRYQKLAFIKAKAHYLARSPNYQTAIKQSKSIIIWGAGKTGKLLHEQLLLQTMTVQAFVDVSAKLIGKKIHEVRIHNAMEFNYENSLVLIAVGTRGVRQMIETHLSKQPYLVDFLAMS